MSVQQKRPPSGPASSNAKLKAEGKYDERIAELRATLSPRRASKPKAPKPRA